MKHRIIQTRLINKILKYKTTYCYTHQPFGSFKLIFLTNITSNYKINT